MTIFEKVVNFDIIDDEVVLRDKQGKELDRVSLYIVVNNWLQANRRKEKEKLKKMI